MGDEKGEIWISSVDLGSNATAFNHASGNGNRQSTEVDFDDNSQTRNNDQKTKAKRRTTIRYEEEPMSLCLRPVIEQWGESYTYSIEHDEVVDLLREIAARAEAGETRKHDYDDLTVVTIEEGTRFLDFLSGGREALLEAKEEGKDNYDLTDEELEAVDEMAHLVPDWRRSLDPDGGFLRIYVD